MPQQPSHYWFLDHIHGYWIHSELVQFRLPQGTKRYFIVTEVSLFPQIVYGFVLENQLAVSVKLAPFSEVTWDWFHLLTSFRWGWQVALSLSANQANGVVHFANEKKFIKKVWQELLTVELKNNIFSKTDESKNKAQYFYSNKMPPSVCKTDSGILLLLYRFKNSFPLFFSCQTYIRVRFYIRFLNFLIQTSPSLRRSIVGDKLH